MKSLQELTRPNIWALKPYSSARDEYSGKTASVFLDANENPYNAPQQPLSRPAPKRTESIDSAGQEGKARTNLLRKRKR